jgi:putative DNA primase/helicase
MGTEDVAFSRLATIGPIDCETSAVSGLTPALWAHDGVDFGFDPRALAPRWQEFLGQIFDDQQSRDTLEEMLGYCMTYDTKFDKGFVLCGVKRSGKTTVLNMLEKLIGSGSYIGMSFSTLRNENSFQDVIGKKTIAFPDARFRPERTFFASRDPGGIDPNVAEFLLNVTGRDTISLGRKYKDRWRGKLFAKVIITTNETPNLYDSSGVLPSRFITLAFKNSFYNHEDVNLQRKLMSELPGIAARSLAALRRLYGRGRFIQPESGKGIGVAMEEKIEPFSKFCHECLELDPADFTISNAILSSIFAVWCERSGTQWLRRQVTDNQLIGKIRAVEGFDQVKMIKPHGRPRLYNLRRKAKREGCD